MMPLRNEVSFQPKKLATIQNLVITFKDPSLCAIRISGRRIQLRKVLEFEVWYQSNIGLIKAEMFVSRKYIFLKSIFPLRGIRTCISNDGSFIKRISLGYFSKAGFVLTEKGEKTLIFLLNDIVNTCKLAQTKPNMIASYYSHVRFKIIAQFPELNEKRITSTIANQLPVNTWLSDTIRKKHYFSYNGINMLLSFQALIQNHPEIFDPRLN